MPTFYGTENRDNISGSSLNDTIFGFGGDDFLQGWDGADVIDGGAGNDVVIDHDGQNPDLYADTLRGGSGDDIVLAGYLDNADGGTGANDRLILRLDYAPGALVADFTAFWTGATYVIDGATLRGFEVLYWLVATAYDDSIILGTPAGRTGQAAGGAGSDLLVGGAGTDYLNADFYYAGFPVGADFYYDELWGQGGNDDLTCGIGDYANGGAGIDVLTFDCGMSGTGVSLNFAVLCITGSDTLLGTQFVSIEDVRSVSGSLYDDTIDLSAEGYAASIAGRDGNDTLFGGSGANSINGGAGADYMAGGGGNDEYYVDDVGDQVVESLGGGTDRINSTMSLALGDNVENLTLSGASALNGTGNALNNSMTGSTADNLLVGASGDDYLIGGAGADTLVGGVGRDQLQGGSGADTFVFADGDFSGAAWGAADIIYDFSLSGGDVIDLTGTDAVAGGADDAFTFIGGGAFTGVAGQLRFAYVGSDTMVYGDTDGDGVADIAIRLTGNLALTSDDFIL